MFMDRILGVFKLRVATFEEIERDPGALNQALIVVVLAAIANAIGSGLGASVTNSTFASSLLGGLIWTVVGWLLWGLVTYIVGTRLFRGQATLPEMLRVIGFAFAPQLLAIIPCVGGLIGGIWSLVAGFIAVRQGLDLDDLRAFVTVLIGFVLYLPGHFLMSVLLNAVLRTLS